MCRQAAHFGEVVSVEPPRPCVSATRASARSSGKCVKFLQHPIEQRELPAQRGVALGRQRVGEMDNHRAEPPCDLHVRRAVEANLDEGEVDEIIPVRRAKNDAQLAAGAEDRGSAKITPARAAQNTLKLIDREHRRRRIVDRRGERLDRDIDEDAAAEQADPVPWCARCRRSRILAACRRRAPRRRHGAGRAAQRRRQNRRLAAQTR